MEKKESDEGEQASSPQAPPRLNSDHGNSDHTESSEEFGPKPFTQPNQQELQTIARTISHQSQEQGFLNPYGDDKELDPRLDPNSEEFNTRFWCQNMARLHSSDQENFPSRELGVCFTNLSAHGQGKSSSFQKTVGNIWYAALKILTREVFRVTDTEHVDILQPMDGVVKPGELLVVLGRPGSGCSTFLRTMAAQTYGFHLGEDTEITYSGLTQHQIIKNFRGDVTYCAESELHHPQLSVGNTLIFASRMKTPRNRLPGVSREDYARHMRDMIMATFGLSHTVNTRVGNDFIRGVSGGERKRVSIAELALCGAVLQCWDNSTRGLDSATAREFVNSLRISADTFRTAELVAIYQASDEMYALFDKVLLLYDGYQIFFGPTAAAREFFYEMGWEPKPRQPTPDFLTSLSQPTERIARKGYEEKVPRTAKEFYERWRESDIYKNLMEEVEQFKTDHPPEGPAAEEFKHGYQYRKSKSLPHSAAYTVSFPEQIKALFVRDIQRLRGDPAMPLTTIFGNFIMGLLLASMFYNRPETTNEFYQRGAILFFALLFNALMSLLEIYALYQGRAVALKHNKYALYHPAIDAVSSILSELPVKIVTCLAFNLTYYFLTNLRRAPGPFFFYLLLAFTIVLCMSHIFRTIGALTRTFEEAMIPADVILLALILFAGFVVPTRKMLGWCRWINYINPLAYSYEALMANEFQNREFPCYEYVPRDGMYDQLTGDNHVCQAVSAIAGESMVSGDAYIEVAYEYKWGHAWRNFGIVCAFTVFFLGTYMLAVWINPGSRTKGDMLVFPRSILRKMQKKADAENLESPQQVLQGGGEAASDEDAKALIESSEDIFYWKDVCYDVKIKSETRRILNHVDGWVKPGTVTALMGASGAGKTTLLDSLANRVSSGVVSGHMFVNDTPRGNSFQRSTGYAMQQDIHLETATVRESLIFSAVLRQPFKVSYEEKVKYVDNILKILEMEPYADAIVGVTGEGLNVEQRKRLTIGIELAAKPKLLLFLDEPTSGLDSQTAWSICQLIKKLSNAGQAILCTIHQPSALLLNEFDRLLFLARGGKTVYFGDIGENAKTLTGYFEKNGADPCPPDANPAEWMLSVIGAAPGSKAKHDYADIWLRSPERKAVRAEIDGLMEKFGASTDKKDEKGEASKEFAAPLWYQFYIVFKRTMELNWRNPLYIWSKFFLCMFSAILNGFTFFKADNSLQGMQNLMFSVFIFTVMLTALVQQYLPSFVLQREMFETRERPSKVFSWMTFIAASICAEIPYQIIVATISFFCWYYPVGFYNNARQTNTAIERGGLAYLYTILFFIYASSLAHLCIAAIPDANTATNIATLLYAFTLNFSGVLATKDQFPGFWIFMYRVSPMTYYIGGMLATAIGNSVVVCADYELQVMQPLEGMTCGEFLGPFAEAARGYVDNPDSTRDCGFCPMHTTNVFLESIYAPYKYRWRNMAIFLTYIVINWVGCIVLYWYARVPKKGSRVKQNKDLGIGQDAALAEAGGKQDDSSTLVESKSHT